MTESFARTLSLAKRGINNYFKKRPFSVSFEVTHSCNARCKHCHLGGDVKEDLASPQELGQICREVRPLIAQASGGEPLLRKDLEQIIDAFRVPNRAPYVVVTTNASLLTKKRYDSLRQAGVDEFSVSLDYPDERHDEFRGIPGLFSQIHSLMKEIRTEKEKCITLCCVIQSDNFRSLIKMAELARQWGVKLNFSAYNSLRTQDLSYMLSEQELEELQEIVKQLLDRQHKYGNIRTSSYVYKNTINYFKERSFPRCRTGEKFFNVNPDGTFSPCGLIIKDYKSPDELYEQFSKVNTCSFCYTSIRANCEKPLKHLVADTIKSHAYS
jgi:MoaA/NifB/PqqE/SkfB family radical SAM enzyme